MAQSRPWIAGMYIFNGSYGNGSNRGHNEQVTHYACQHSFWLPTILRLGQFWWNYPKTVFFLQNSSKSLGKSEKTLLLTGWIHCHWWKHTFFTSTNPLKNWILTADFATTRMVYPLAWAKNTVTPRKQQTNMYLPVFCGLCIDLEMCDPLKNWILFFHVILVRLGQFT